MENFADLKAFVKNFINYFELKRKGLTPQIGVIPYSDKVLANLVINFRYSRSSSWLKSKVDSLSFDGGRGSRLDLALRSTPSLLFRRIKGSRAWVPHVVLAIIGSAASWDRPLTEAIKREALALRTQGFQLMVAAIGLTDQTDRAALESMVASKDDLYIVRYSYGLAQVASKIMQQACPKPSKLLC